MKYFLHIFVFLLLCLSMSGSVIAAQTGLGTGGTQTDTGVGGTQTGVGGGSNSVALQNPIKAESIQALLTAIIDILLVFAIPLIVFFIILAGFKYVTARGNEHTISEAHMSLLYALIGGVLILGARVLIEVISGTVDAIKN